MELIFLRVDFPLDLSDGPNREPRQRSSLSSVLAVRLRVSQHANSLLLGEAMGPGTGRESAITEAPASICLVGC